MNIAKFKLMKAVLFIYQNFSSCYGGGFLSVRKDESIVHKLYVTIIGYCLKGSKYGEYKV